MAERKKPFPRYTNMNTKDDITPGASHSSTGEVFGGLYEQYLPKVFHYVSYRVGDRPTAEDLTSDIFSKALTNFARYDPEKAGFPTWIFSIARNTIIDYYRKRGIEQRLRQKEAESKTQLFSESPKDEVARADEARKLHEYLALLKPNEQELIALKFGGEMTNREISKIIGLSESNVGTILCRTMRKLRDCFLEK